LVTRTEDEIRVYFGVFHFGQNPQVVTDLMGREPTVAWCKGESYGDHGAVRTHSRWELRSPAFPSAPVEEQLGSLLGLLEESAEQVRSVAAQFEAGICCAVKYWVSFNPGIHLSGAAVSRAAALGLSIDFDLDFLAQGQPDGESAA
jgi:hypothetical protein